jgi:hypothetical protein
MAGSASAGFFTGMFDFNTVFQGRITNSRTGLGFNDGTFRADIFMG